MGRDLSQFASPANCVGQEIDFKEGKGKNTRYSQLFLRVCRLSYCGGRTCRQSCTGGTLGCREGEGRLGGHSREDKEGCPQTGI